jgi:murein DD-endopeptidase MepM/ murein hydrolase activator NlpD
VDLLGHAGQQVRTALGGTVTFAAPLAGRGVVVVDHGGVRTTYEPVSASVVVGDVVTRGAAIGLLRRAQSHCFPRTCLHWGLRRGETYLNPLTLVGAGPVRLLPLVGPLDVPLGGAPAFTRLDPRVPVASFRPGGGRAGRPGAAVPW